MADLYDALRSAGSSERSARRAATGGATYEGRFAAIETRLALLTVMTTLSMGGIISLMVEAVHQ